jgi:ABC-type transporter Mla MlaB component
MSFGLPAGLYSWETKGDLWLATSEESPARVSLLVCDVGALKKPDVVVVDALARLQLAVKRLGCQLQLANAREDLQELLDLMGLSEVFPLYDGVNLKTIGQSEEREQTRRIEEETNSGDFPV